MSHFTNLIAFEAVDTLTGQPVQAIVASMGHSFNYTTRNVNVWAAITDYGLAELKKYNRCGTIKVNVGIRLSPMRLIRGSMLLLQGLCLT